MRTHRSILVASAALLAAAPLPAKAQAVDTEIIAERIHSRLPLYTFAWKDLWPRNFYAEDSFGCTSRVGFGDWRFTPAAGNEFGEERWERYRNYGVVHCAAVIRSADSRGSLEEAPWAHGFFVRLGTGRLQSEEWELWALQKGMVPGSEYILFARQAGLGGLVDKFRVLQQRCPTGRLLEADGLDIWLTRYCAINSQAELLALARDMLRLPPRGTIERAPPLPAPSPTTADNPG